MRDVGLELRLTVPRIAPVGTPGARQRELLEKTLLGPGGEFLNVFSTLAHQPRLLRRINPMGAYFNVDGALTDPARELVTLRTARHASSGYEIGQHRRLALGVGITTQEIDAVVVL